MALIEYPISEEGRPVSPSGIPVAGGTLLPIGSTVLVFEQGRWWRAVVLGHGDNSVKVHFPGWESKWDGFYSHQYLQADQETVPVSSKGSHFASIWYNLKLLRGLIEAVLAMLNVIIVTIILPLVPFLFLEHLTTVLPFLPFLLRHYPDWLRGLPLLFLISICQIYLIVYRPIFHAEREGYPVSPSGIPVAGGTLLRIGSTVLVFEQGRWWRAVVLDHGDNSVKVHFPGWESEWDGFYSHQYLQVDQETVPAPSKSDDFVLQFVKGLPKMPWPLGVIVGLWWFFLGIFLNTYAVAVQWQTQNFSMFSLGTAESASFDIRVFFGWLIIAPFVVSLSSGIFFVLGIYTISRSDKLTNLAWRMRYYCCLLWSVVGYFPWLAAG